MVQVWRQDKPKPATIQTYLSFLRGLAKWLGKNGFVRGPAHYGLEIDEYQRHEAAERDKSWSAQHIDRCADREGLRLRPLRRCITPADLGAGAAAQGVGDAAAVCLHRAV